jgi:PAS domain-containing protein
VFTRSIGSGTPYEIVQRLRRSDGVYRWFQNSGFPFRDAGDHIVRWCVLLTDIDERKRAEDALRASERNFQLITDTIPALAWSARPDGNADFFNQHYLTSWPLVRTGDRPGVDGCCPPRRFERPGRDVAAHHGFRSAGRPRPGCAGTTGPIGGSCSARTPARREREHRQVAWINTDIEDRKRAEVELRRAYDSFADAQRLSKPAASSRTWSGTITTGPTKLTVSSVSSPGRESRCRAFKRPFTLMTFRRSSP